MAVDDLIVGTPTQNAVQDFQPASGVEVVITALSQDGSSNNGCGWYDGTNISKFSTPITNETLSFKNMKVGINNSVYLRLPNLGAGTFTCYSGIQTK